MWLLLWTILIQILHWPLQLRRQTTHRTDASMRIQLCVFKRLKYEKKRNWSGRQLASDTIQSTIHILIHWQNVTVHKNMPIKCTIHGVQMNERWTKGHLSPWRSNYAHTRTHAPDVSVYNAYRYRWSIIAHLFAVNCVCASVSLRCSHVTKTTTNDADVQHSCPLHHESFRFKSFNHDHIPNQSLFINASTFS